MFGYVCPVDSMLDEAARNAFRSSYCGVCRYMGTISRFALSYECAFLALLYDGLTAMPIPSRRFCRAIPLRRRPMVIGDNQRYAADINSLLAYYKLRDDVHDHGGLKARLLCALFLPSKLAAKRRQPKAAALIETKLAELYRLEQQKCQNVDELSHAFATLLQGIGAPGFDCAGALGRFFYDLGRWIYIVDALMDYEEDKKARRFNALWAYESLSNAREAMAFSLWHGLSKMELSLQALHPSEPSLAVCNHILYDVLPTHTLRALGQVEGGRDSESLSGTRR